ncbi:DeoR/GlpR family DNA-binding transcription regulator [Paenibacillus thalictri]|uniref:DeoR/GlpR transcriptional regulator n=1 Tax=Paenibacillus thalictri TaxID=2527873 RepID=A0A4Q9DQC3_9BACL|nr:DeoR/GlpR family DNA-binding transcription regulator [Paenibacillus thalictri]TBL78603.1 DeoR/GlpR transcriptional regulator [Paenibacillus thalictri]
MSLVGEERKKKILDLLDSHGKVRSPELVKHLDVSAESVRRYLEELEQEQKLRRVYGGAVKWEAAHAEPPYRAREIMHLEQKMKIGRKAAELVEDDDVIFLDDGTTGLQMIGFLQGKKRLKVVTVCVSSLNTLIEQKNKGCFDGEILFIGGRINAEHNRVSGALACDFAASLHVDKAFIAADGVHIEGGVTSFDDERGILSRLFLKNSQQVIVLSDHTKLSNIHLHRIGRMEEIDMIVSDVPPPEEWRAKLEEYDIHWFDASLQES